MMVNASVWEGQLRQCKGVLVTALELDIEDALYLREALTEGAFSL